jgi:hypothetical protein
VAHPLDDPRAKLSRAEHHLLTLNGEWEAWKKSYPYYILVESNEDNAFWEFSVRRFGAEVKPEDDVFGLLIGDYVNNLRAALDQLAWQLVIVANKRKVKPTDRRDIYFPIVEAGAHPRDYWNLSPLRYFSVEQGSFFEGFQPYRRTDFPKALPTLNAFWNADKHRLINPVEVRLTPEDGLIFEVVHDAKIIETHTDADIPLEGDAKVGWAKTETTGPDPLVKVQNLRIQVLLGERKLRFNNLAALGDVAREIIEGSAQFFE